MNTSKRRQIDYTVSSATRSTERPTAGTREHRQAFWEAITRGLTNEDAALKIKISRVVATRWFRENGGMPPTNIGAVGNIVEPKADFAPALLNREVITASPMVIIGINGTKYFRAPGS